jgi:hypothetical protein
MLSGLIKFKERKNIMSVFYDALCAIEWGAKFKINLKEKTLKINNKDILLEDELITKEDINLLCLNSTEPWEIVEELYERYKRSSPSAKSNGNKPYFKALKADELNDNDIAFGRPRDMAQAELELFILFGGMTGLLQWQNDKHWFLQGKDKELIVLREWI